MSFYPPAERELSKSDALALVASSCPGLGVRDIEVLGVGFDNVAYLIDDTWVFRFCRRELGVQFLEAELRVLPKLADRLTVPVPVLEHHGLWGNPPWPFAGHRLVPGRTSCGAKLDDRQRALLALPIAEFLATLHAVPATDARAWGARPDSTGRLDLVARPPRIRRSLTRISQRGLFAIEPLERLLEALVDALGEGPACEDGSTLVHGDLYSRHLLLDADAGLCGVIDWGDVHLGHAAVDLAVVHAFLPGSAHAEFFDRYGPVDERTWMLARFHALSHASSVVASADEVGDRDLLREGLVSLHNLSSREPC